MRGYFAVYDKTLYELSNHDMTPKTVVITPESTHMESISRPDIREFTEDITISDLSANAATNKEMFEDVKKDLLGGLVTSIDQLSPTYRIYVEYLLYDNTCGVTVDEGVSVKEVKASAFNFVLGVTDDNEYATRLALELGATITHQYRSTVPYGVMRNVTPDFSLYIRRIYVAEVMMKAYSIVPTDETVVSPYTGKYVNAGTVGAFGGHPSIDTVTEASSLNMESKIIYDTAVSGLTFDALRLKFKPSIININLRFLFNDMFVVADRDDIISIIEANKEAVENPVVPDEPVVNPDEGTTTPTEPSTGTGSGEITTPTDPSTGEGTDVTDPSTGGSTTTTEGTETTDPSTSTGETTAPDTTETV